MVLFWLYKYQLLLVKIGQILYLSTSHVPVIEIIIFTHFKVHVMQRNHISYMCFNLVNATISWNTTFTTVVTCGQSAQVPWAYFSFDLKDIFDILLLLNVTIFFFLIFYLAIQTLVEKGYAILGWLQPIGFSSMYLNDILVLETCWEEAWTFLCILLVCLGLNIQFCNSEINLTWHFLFMPTLGYNEHVSIFTMWQTSWDTALSLFFVTEAACHHPLGYVFFGERAPFVPLDRHNFAHWVMSLKVTCWMFGILQLIYFFLSNLPSSMASTSDVVLVEAESSFFVTSSSWCVY